MKLRPFLLLSILCLLPALSHAQTAGGVQSINGVPGPFTFGSGSTCVGTTCTFSGGGGSLPTSNAIGDTLFATAASSTTYTARTLSKIPVELYGATPYASEAAAEAGPDDTADFQAAVTAAVGGAAMCQAGKWYHVVGPVNFITNEALIGSSNQTYGAQCLLVTTSASTKVLSAVGTSGAYLSGITWANLAIYRSVAGTGTSAGFYSSFAGGGIVTNTRSNDSIYDYYRHASPAYGIGYWSYNQAGGLLGETTGTYYGFYDDSADGNAENSIILTHSAMACQNFAGATTYGQILTGTAVNDNRTFDFNTSGCTYGQVVNYTGGGATVTGQDIHFNASTHDTVGTAFQINNLPQSSRGSVTITDAWMSGTGSTSYLVDCESSYGVSVVNSMFLGPNNTAIYEHACDGMIAANNTISTDANGGGTLGNIVVLNGTTHSAVTGNKIYGISGTGGNLIWLTGNSTYNSITGNTLSGYSSAGAGIRIDAGSNNNYYPGNAIDTTHITSGGTIQDASGTGSQISPSGSALVVQNTNANIHVPIGNYYAPNATYGSTCLAYEQFGVAAATNNAVQRVFGCLGTGSATNFYGWRMQGASIYPAAIFSNGSLVVGATSPVAGPTNGLAVTGAVTAPSYSASGTTFTASGCSNGTLVGGATAGSFNSGTSGTCTVTVTMGASQAAAHGWACSVHDLTTPADTINETPGSTTTAVFTGTTVTGDVIAFGCMGY